MGARVALAFAVAFVAVLAATRAGCEPVPVEVRLADPSTEAAGVELRFLPSPDLSQGVPAVWHVPEAQPIDSEPWPWEAWVHCYRAGTSIPGSGWIQARVQAADGRISPWSAPHPVAEPPAAVGLSLGVAALFRMGGARRRAPGRTRPPVPGPHPR